MSETFKVGDVVEWTSQAGGSTRTKVGVVTSVLKPGEAPPPISKNRNPGMARDHETYLVRVKGSGLYWPRTAALRKARGEEP